MAKAASAASQLADIGNLLIAQLTQHRSLHGANPDSPWLKRNQMLQALPQQHHEFATHALTKVLAKTTIVVAMPDAADSPVATLADLHALAHSPQLLINLIQHPQHGCSADTPVQPLTELVRSLDKRLQKPVLAAWLEEACPLPAGVNAVRSTKGKKTLVSFHDTRFPRRESLLATRLLTALQQATTDPTRPFTTLADLLTLASIASDDPALPATLSLPEIETSIRTLRGRGIDAWIAHSERIIQSLGNPLLLAHLLTETCSTTSPEIRLSALAKLLAKDIQPLFVTAWLQTSAAAALENVCHVTPAGTPRKPDLLLRDLRFPSPEKLTSQKLLHSLRQAKAETNSQYPLPWSTLQQLASPDTPREILHKATLTEPFSSQAIIACPVAPDSPVFLKADIEACTHSSELLSFLVRRSTTDDNVALAPQKLSAAAGLHPAVKQLLNTVADQLITGMPLPPGIGLARIARKWLLLDLNRVRHGSHVAAPAASAINTTTPPSSSPNPPANTEAFQIAFDAAFKRLSQTSHLPGYVSLADLRPAFSEYPRDDFDRQLLRLRQAGLYSLSLLEGRLALTPAEESAVIILDNRPYLLVHRR
ncbi:MAG UNVERIFIED_CONTAM: hypothetical protein LVR18_24115 [Planctomycetaceae bacterium]|jgi:hypothetical protein